MHTDWRDEEKAEGQDRSRSSQTEVWIPCIARGGMRERQRDREGTCVSSWTDEGMPEGQRGSSVYQDEGMRGWQRDRVSKSVS